MTVGRASAPVANSSRKSNECATRSSFSSITGGEKPAMATLRFAAASSQSSSGGSGAGAMQQRRRSLESLDGSSPSFRTQSASPTPLHPSNGNATSGLHSHHHHHQRGSMTSQRGSVSSRVSSLTKDSSIHSLDPLKIEIADLTHIFGRSKEQELLQSAFVRVLRQDHLVDKKKELVMVHGKAGTGKTALVMDFKDAVTSTGAGYFCSGKFKRYHTVAAPYSGIVQAMNELCEAISTSIGHDKGQRRTALYQAFGPSQLQDLTSLLPKLENFLSPMPRDDSDDDVPSPRIWDDRTKELPSVLHDFLRALCSPTQPIIMFLDDLQWADPESLDCISNFVRDKSLVKFMVLGAFRDDETCSIPFLSDDIGNTITDIELDNLPLSSVDDILSDLTGSPGVNDLAKIVLQKTHGNPFSIFQFLDMLQRKELLVFSFHTHKWIWDVEEIKSKTEVTQNVGYTLVQNIDNLSREVSKMLTLAAVVGFSFDPKVLEFLATHLALLEDEYREHLTNTVKEVIQDAVSGGLIHPDQTQAVLATQIELVEEGSNSSLKQSFYEEVVNTAIQEAEAEGLISKAVNRSKYRFSHDIVQKSFYENTTLDIERHKLHLQIGRVLRSFYTVRPEDVLLFASVDHLNKGSHFVDSDDERIDLIQLNQKSSEKARARSALFSAANFLSKAIDLLKFEHDWMNNYDLLLNLYNDAAELNFACGRFDLSLRRCLEIHRHARNLQDKLHASYIRIEVLFSQRKITEAINSCLTVLEQLGEPLDRKPNRLQVLSEWRKARKMTRGRPNESLLSLPSMNDPIKKQTQRYLSLLVDMTLSAMDEHLLAIAVFRSFQNTLVHGLCVHTPHAIACYGMLCSSLGTCDEAFHLGEIALKMCDQMESDSCIPGTYVTVYTTLYHLKQPLLNGVAPLLKAYRIGVGNGEVQFAAACTAASARIAFHCALPLKSYAEDLKNVCDQLKLLKQESSWAAVFPYWKAAMDLSNGGTKEERESASTLFDSFLEADNGASQSGHFSFIWCNYFMVTYIVMYIFNNYDDAYSVRNKMTLKIKSRPRFYHFMTNLELLFSGLLNFALYRRFRVRAILRQAKAVTKRMQKMVQAGMLNCQGMMLLLRAELESFGRNFELAKSLYDDSIRVFGAFGFIHLQAIANERAAEYMKAVNKPRIVWQSYLRNATQHYAEWGATAKVTQLVEFHRLPARYSIGDKPCPVITIHGEQGLHCTPIEGDILEEDFMSSEFISSDLFTSENVNT